MSVPNDAMLQFERRLREEADRFALGLRLFIGGDAIPEPREVEPADRRARCEALAAEDARLRRKARRGAPSYDLNRHIAVRRLLALWGAAAAGVPLRRSSPAPVRGCCRTGRPG